MSVRGWIVDVRDFPSGVTRAASRSAARAACCRMLVDLDYAQDFRDALSQVRSVRRYRGADAAEFPTGGFVAEQFVQHYGGAPIP